MHHMYTPIPTVYIVAIDEDPTLSDVYDDGTTGSEAGPTDRDHSE